MSADQITAEINRLIQVLRHDQSADGSWNYPFETGVVTDCYMVILLRMLEIENDNLLHALVERIMSKQEPDGSWKLFHDEADGNHSLTVEAYFALLYSQFLKPEDIRLAKAKKFISSRGGLKQTSTFTKIMLAINGQYSWQDLFQLPVEIVLLPLSFPLNFFDLAVFTRANFAPIAILSDQQFSIKTSRTPDLSELSVARQSTVEVPPIRDSVVQSVVDLIAGGIEALAGLPEMIHNDALNRAEHYMLTRIEPDGTLESYFSATFLMIYALLARGRSKTDPVIRRAVQGIETWICQIEGQAHVQYTSANVWNTALISYALQEAGLSPESAVIQQANHYLLSRQQSSYGDWMFHQPAVQPGGWGFSNINTINPDVDDTTAALRSIQPLSAAGGRYREAWDRGVSWVLAMQNDDGGWPAFERKVDKRLLTLLPIEQAEDILIDPSTADLTGRTLHFFGTATDIAWQSPVVRNGCAWLIRHQNPDGSWPGRWGIYSIYGTWAAVTGLIAVGLSPDHPTIQRAVDWLLKIKNADGGWGESCKSDTEKKYTPLGISTRTQTAWATDALIAAAKTTTSTIEGGISFLTNVHAQEPWAANYPKGRGMAGAFYMHYHSYDIIWPLLTLVHFKRKFYSDD
ncbi:MAG: squalene--hopene cyclase [Sporolactobacillus sp.]|jgi:sporulenol synthase|nr:squalene--hopene cyclase [Sporolactobacillus sp.]